jgi:fumarylpyruvate hydrolase
MIAVDYTHVPAPVYSVPVVGKLEQYPVRRIYCVGRNYADHALEMGIDPRTEAPFFFCKPTDTVLAAADQEDVLEVPYPSLTNNLHHEVELVVAIGRGGRDIAVGTAMEHIYGYAVGIDLTRRDLQLAMRKSGRPWEIGKTFDRCAPISAIHPLTSIGSIDGAAITLHVDDTLRQFSTLDKLIWSVPEIVADLSRHFTLQPGDLIFTGTPEGVGPVTQGQVLTASIEGLGALKVRISPAYRSVA